MDKVIISVIIPVYNTEKYLKQTIESILNQTIKWCEFIFVDDGSTDSSMTILKEYGKRDSRIKVLKRSVKDNGSGGARNMGMDAAKGKYLVFLDSDDLFEPEMLEILYKNAETNKADIVVCDSYIYKSESQIDVYNGTLNRDYVKRECVYKPIERAEYLFQQDGGAVWNKMFSRNFIFDNKIRFRENINIVDDSEFSYVAVASANRISVMLDRFVHYRRDASGSQTSGYDDHPEIIYVPWLYLKKNLEERGLFDTYRTTFHNKVLEYIRFLLTNFKSLEGYEKAYSLLKETGLHQLGLINENKYDFSWQKRMISNIYSCSPYEFLFRFTRDNSLYSGFNLSLPYASGGKKRVLIYGAGECGREIVKKFKTEKKIEMVSWHDKNYMNSGDDIESPDSIAYKEYDYIFVAVVARDVFCEIKDELIDMGVEKEKILWVGTPWID